MQGRSVIMLETVIEMQLPIAEKFVIRKNRLVNKEIRKPSRLSIVSGIHGDELEGQYICYELARRIQEHPEFLTGIVDIYPVLNPFGLDRAKRNIPVVEMDMNRMFPGDSNGNLIERVTAAVVDDIIGSDLCVDVHASDIFVREIPQVRLSEDFAEKLLPYARLSNMDMIWMNATTTVHESTLAHSLNVMGVPTMVLEMGLGNNINILYGDQVVDGFLNLMKELGIWSGPVPQTQMPVISSDGKVNFIRSEVTGIFLPRIEHNHYVRKGNLIGEIVDPFTGEIKKKIHAGEDGLLFTLRVYPVVYEGDLIARILTDI